MMQAYTPHKLFTTTARRACSCSCSTQQRRLYNKYSNSNNNNNNSLIKNSHNYNLKINNNNNNKIFNRNSNGKNNSMRFSFNHYRQIHTETEIASINNADQLTRQLTYAGTAKFDLEQVTPKDILDFWFRVNISYINNIHICIYIYITNIECNKTKQQQ